MAVTTKGRVLTGTYATILTAHPARFTTEFINHGGATAFITVGGSEDDADAVEVPMGTSYFSTVPFGGEVKAKGDGKLVVVTNNQEDD